MLERPNGRTSGKGGFTMRAERVDFPNAQGLRLAALLNRPEGPTRAIALFAHCFTCSKDVFAAKRISEALADQGIAVLRFDFTGLGASEGEFANTSFSSNVDDLVAAADWLRAYEMAPAILIGHSLGGSAVLAAAERIPEAVAVATMAAPFDPAHAGHLFESARPEIEARGKASVVLAGRSFTVTQEFLDDLQEQRQAERIQNLKRALLVFHGPRDEIVGIDHASQIFQAARHPKSFVSLDDADHLLTRRADAAYVAVVLAAWATRYLAEAPVERAPAGTPDGEVVVRETGVGGFQQAVRSGRHRLLADEPVSFGGLDTGPGPYDLLLAALGACTSMTIRMYAERKKLALEAVEVRLRHRKIHAEDCADCETRRGRVDEIERDIVLEGDLDRAVTDRLLEIADKCPVHRTLEGEIKVRTRLAG